MDDCVSALEREQFFLCCCVRILKFGFVKAPASTHVVLDCRRCRSPQIQIYTDNLHLAHSLPERGTVGIPLGSTLDEQTGDSYYTDLK